MSEAPHTNNLPTQPQGQSAATTGSKCRRCADTGTMSWQQPTPGPDGTMVLRNVTHPCTCQAARDAGVWRHPAAERDRVIGRNQLPDELAATLRRIYRQTDRTGG
ncbi:hypothetical protein Acsp05_71230 [Actinokineospora sp. NBRC 105648]|nr:hypothetical protein Acsp05_71230 [Actinokineospora sp. NBRC 105648]